MKTLFIGSLNANYDDESVFIHGLLREKDLKIRINLGKVFYPLLPFYVFPKAIICNRVIIVTKLYTRPSLLLLCISLIVCKLCFCKVEVYLYPELFNYFGKFRSKLVGENLIKIFLGLCSKIWYSNDTTKEVISIYNKSAEILYHYDHMVYMKGKRTRRKAHFRQKTIGAKRGRKRGGQWMDDDYLANMPVRGGRKKFKAKENFTWLG